MSFNESNYSGGEESEVEVVMYQCSHCNNGKTYTAEEKDAHKLWHKAEKKRKAKEASRKRNL